MAESAPPRVMVTVPCYNHPDTVRRVVEGVLAHHQDVLVVDDGSDEPVADLLDGLDIEVVRHETNRGKGVALRTAAQWGGDRGMTHMITIDADAQHDPADLPRFLQAVRDEPHVLWIGARDFGTTDNVPAASRFGRSFSGFWYAVQTGEYVSDCQSGFRAYPLPVITDLFLVFRRFCFETEVLIFATWAGVTVKEMTVRTWYPPGAKRISHFNRLRDNFMMSVLNAGLCFRGFMPWPHKKLFLGSDRQTRQDRYVSLLHPRRSVLALRRDGERAGTIALSAAVGMVCGSLPLFGARTQLTTFLCRRLRLNRAACFAVYPLCIPPFLPFAALQVGHLVRNGHWLTEFSRQTVRVEFGQRVLDWLLGGFVVGPTVGLLLALAALLLAWSLPADEHEHA